MAINLKGRSFLTLEDFTPAEIRYLLDLGHDLKAKRRAGICDPTLQGKHIVLLFEKTSTRTRCSFEVAATQEGAHVTYLDAGSCPDGQEGVSGGHRQGAGPVSSTASSTGATTRRWWRIWRSTPACRCGTASPTQTTPPRSWRT